MTLEEALHLALEAMKIKQHVTMWENDGDKAKFNKAIKAVEAALQVKDEPVGRVVSANCEYATVQWLRQTSEVGGGDPKNSRSWPIAGDAIYTTPPRRKPLTDEDIWACLPKDPDEMAFARAIEAAHGIKG